MFNHIEIDYPTLDREMIDGVRYYDTPDGQKLVSITSIISHYNREIFTKWRKRVGVDEANKITKAATSRGTDMHTLVENYMLNKELPTVQPLSEFLFKQAKPDLDKIDNIHAIEQALFSRELGVAGTVDCIAEYDGELAVIDFKTSKKPKPEKWIEHYYVQCAAYACMLYEMTGIVVSCFIIVMSCESGECVVYKTYSKKKYIKLLLKYIRTYCEDKLESIGK
jgi:genome maintenance exonuclease 1